jgi:hypothetical protein
MTSTLLARRLAQIHDQLMRMRRRVTSGAGSSFIVFAERPTKDAQSPPITDSERLEDGGLTRYASSGDSRHGDDTFSYYVQFSFDEDDFRIDLPEETLHPEDAQRLLAERQGFFWLRDTNGESPHVRDFNPLQKLYAYGQERLAAADVLFILLDVWRVPVDFCWYVKAAPFQGGGYWEYGEPMA